MSKDFFNEKRKDWVRHCKHSNAEVDRYESIDRWVRVHCTDCHHRVSGHIGDLWIAPWAQHAAVDYEKASVLLK